jgi:hypothetical protein
LLSIPVTWDFPLHLPSEIPSSHHWIGDILFQFPLLGIFRCTSKFALFVRRRGDNFQFPLLGIFRCTIPLLN